nr:ARID DNA-binding domain-containing protein [Tanacetum cinerariifolium]
MNLHTGKRNWRERFPAITNSEHWHQSTKPRKYRNKPSQMEFVQRKIKREREGFDPYLIRKGGALSNEWEVHRDKFNHVLTWFFNHFLMRPLPGSLPPIIKGVTIHLFDLYELIECMGGYISVQFEDDFEGLTELLGLERSDGLDGLDIRRCYLDYLELFVSNYKAARSSNPTGGYEDEGIRRFEDYHGDGNKDGSTAVKEKKRVKHFGITFEKEEEGKLERSDGLDIRRCYLDYLELFVSNYKAARSSNPTGGYEDEGIRRFEDYHVDGSYDVSWKKTKEYTEI